MRVSARNETEGIVLVPFVRASSNEIPGEIGNERRAVGSRFRVIEISMEGRRCVRRVLERKTLKLFMLDQNGICSSMEMD